jgi:hypothetical protein
MLEYVLCLAAYHETLIQVYIHTDQVDIPELCHFLCSYYGDFFAENAIVLNRFVAFMATKLV